MALTWTEDLAVGFGRIDEQHQELFSRYNSLLDACHSGEGRETLAPLLTFLSDYVVEHFGEEEWFMMRYRYPEMQRHIAQHRELVDKITHLHEDLERNGPNLNLLGTLTHSLIHWLVSHVKNSDVKLGSYLGEKVH